MEFNPFDPYRNKILNQQQHQQQMMQGMGIFGMGGQAGIGMGGISQLQYYSNKKSESSDLLLLTIEGDIE